jgi:diguanylate cyclase (GGDEF)-like protein
VSGEVAAQRPTILVVDDEPTTRLLTSATLAPEGFAVVEADSGPSALAAFAAARPSLVLLDVNMPGMDGYAVCAAMRSQPGARYVPIVMMTGRDDIESINEAYRAGATDFIAKPVNWPLLPHRMRYVMRSSRLNRITAVLSGINSAIVRTRHTRELFAEACRVAVDEGHFKLAWIGTVDPLSGRVEPVASAGNEQGYIALLRMGTREGTSEDGGVVGEVVRGGKAVICNDIPGDTTMLTRHEAVARGFRARVGLPLRVDDAIVGVLLLYASETGFFDEEEMKLLLELAGDVSFALEYNAKREKLDHLAYYDALTGAPNRTLYHERLERLTQAERRDGAGLAVVVLDVKGFHTINDNMGRHAGDALLRLIARRLEQNVRAADTVARIGGDRFGLILGDVASEAQLGSRVERVFAALAEAYPLDGHLIRLTAKGGVTVYPSATDGADADGLVTNAEAALKRAKSLPDPYLFYAPNINAAITNRLLTESRLLRALEEGQFELYYQPQVASETRRITGLEALLRWNDPEQGLVLPRGFVRLLEETGMILEVGGWVLRQAIADSCKLRAMGLEVPRVAINVSSLQMRQKDFPAYIAAATHGAEPGSLDIEITESSIMDDVEGCIAALREVRRMGIGVALDDFGTGYSSLSCIARLPATVLKLDKSFVDEMAKGSAKLAIVSAVIALGHAHDMQVVAEGVETEEQAKLLRLLRCDHQQGFLYASPMPLDQLAAALARETPRETV